MMATLSYSSKPNTPHHVLLLLTTFITTLSLLLLKANSSSSLSQPELSFSFKKFWPNQPNLLFQGDTQVSSDGVLQITKVENGQPVGGSFGRALYHAPVHIWDKATGQVASFETSFSFVIKASHPDEAANGFAFFLGPTDSEVITNSHPGYFGLFNTLNYDSSKAIVAVEFDPTFGHDSCSRHVGIDINTARSNKTAVWHWRNGEVAEVSITYEARTKRLTTYVAYPLIGTSSVLVDFIDLKAVLPEWVRVGFSGASGGIFQFSETHNVLNWHFTSTFKEARCCCYGEL
ncbi:hypothetical protein RIF29_05994 [Crotalaria pallida]|uniref:Legume lectin domain-containing protein n=1 Tax=Crotalaria pallida TaxID=3830 RepID=A0AAN9J2P4_CROPI